MAQQFHDSSTREERLNNVLAGYLEAERTGRAPDREALLAQHPDLAEELRSFFRDQDRFAHLAEPLPPPANPAEAITLGPKDSVVDPAVGKVRNIGDHELLEEIARGGMGVVYKARQTKLQRVVALKMILAGSHAGAADLARFRTEAEAIARLQHPNIVQVFEVGEHEGKPFCSLEYCDGGSLAEKLNGTPLPPTEGAEIVETLARAMAEAHAKGIIHRDLKPANVLLTSTGRESRDERQESRGEKHSADSPLAPPLSPFVSRPSPLVPKITDFGLAKKLDDVGQTQSGAVMGTPSYMAPEQAGGKTKEIGPAADIYALGAILYECLTGRPPFRAATPLDTLLQVVSEDPVPPSQLQSRTPGDLETICLKCLAKEPSKRYRSGEELAEDLRRYRAGEPIRARPVGPAERAAKWVGRHKGLSAGLAAAVVALLIGTGVATWFAIDAHASAVTADKEAKAARDLATAEAEATVAAEVNRQKAEAARRDADRERDRALRQLALSRRHLCTAQLMRVRGIMDQDPATAIDLLHDCSACPFDLRDFAWGWYEGRCCREPDTIIHIPGAIPCLTFSGDGKLLAFGVGDPFDHGQRGLVHIWDLVSGQEKVVLKGHINAVLSVGFSSDGKLLASGSGSFDLNSKAVASGEVKLWDAESGEEKLSLKGHTGAVDFVAFSGDGKALVSASHDKTVRLWDVIAGKEQTVFNGLNDVPGRCLALSRDGKLLATVSGTQGNDVRLWDIVGGKDSAVLKGHTDRVRALAFSADGKLLASGSEDKTVQIWDVAKAQSIVSIKGHADAVTFVAFSADGRLLATSGPKTFIRLWHVASGQEKILPKGYEGPVSALAFSNDGKLLAAGGWANNDSMLEVWSDVAKGPESATCVGHTDLVTSVAFTRDGRLLASGNADKTVRLWDMTTYKEKAVLKGHKGDVRGVAFSSDGKLLASGSSDPDRNKTLRGEVKLWDVATGLEKATFTTEDVTSLALSSDGKLLASGRWETITLWDVGTTKQKATLSGHTGGVRSLAFSSDGKLLASGGEEYDLNERKFLPGKIKLWDVATGQAKVELQGHTNIVTSVAFSGDDKLLASASWDQTVKIWDVSTGQEKTTLRGHKSQVACVAFSADGAILASGGGGPDEPAAVRLWDVATAQEKAALPAGAGRIAAMAFSGDGTLLASAKAGDGKPDQQLKLWPIGTSHRKAILKGHTNTVTATAFSPDSKLLASASWDKTIKVWDMATGQEKATLKGHGRPVLSVAFSADGKLLLSGGGEERRGGELKLWDVASGEELTAFEGHTATVLAVAFSDDSKLVASVSADSDHSIKLWDVDARKEKATLKGHKGPVYAVAFSGDSRLLVSGGGPDLGPGELKLWDVATGKEEATLEGHTSFVQSVSFCKDGKLLESASWDGVKLWDVATRKQLSGPAWPSLHNEARNVAFSSDGKLLACCGATDIRFWDVAAGRERGDLNFRWHSYVGQGMAFSPDSTMLALGVGDSVTLWNVHGARQGETNR